MITLQRVKVKQPEWFSKENMRFFSDISYKVLQGGKSKNYYLVRSTYAWTDMFGNERKKHYRINSIKEDLSIGWLIEKVFDDLDSVEEWLKEN